MSAYALAYQTVRADRAALQRHTHRWAAGLARGWGVEVVAFGAERVPLDVPCVLIANHQSHTDVVALFLAMPVQPVFLAKKELRSVPVFGRVMETGGHVFVDRRRHDSAVDTIDAAAKNLRAGSPLLVFPEGTRGFTHEVQAFKKGGFHLARKAGAPIVPIGIRGSRDVWPRERRAPLPGRIEVHVGVPISAEDVAATPLDEMTDRVRVEVARLADLPLAPD